MVLNPNLSRKSPSDKKLRNLFNLTRPFLEGDDARALLAGTKWASPFPHERMWVLEMLDGDKG